MSQAVVWTGKRATKKNDRLVATGVQRTKTGGTINWRIHKSITGVNHKLYLGDATVPLVSRQSVQECKQYAVDYI